jgi:hypothetical protein
MVPDDKPARNRKRKMSHHRHGYKIREVVIEEWNGMMDIPAHMDDAP